MKNYLPKTDPLGEVVFKELSLSSFCKIAHNLINKLLLEIEKVYLRAI